MLLTDEQYVIKWLSQYGPLPKAQVVRLLRDKSPTTAERLLNRMKRDQRIADVGDGYYLGLDPYCTPDQRVILAVWVLLQFIDRVEPLAHYPATYPSQLFFLKENTSWFYLRYPACSPRWSSRGKRSLKCISSRRR